MMQQRPMSEPRSTATRSAIHVPSPTRTGVEAIGLCITLGLPAANVWSESMIVVNALITTPSSIVTDSAALIVQYGRTPTWSPIRIAGPGRCQEGCSAASQRPWNISTLEPISILSGRLIHAGLCRIESRPNAANWRRRYGAVTRPRQTTRCSFPPPIWRRTIAAPLPALRHMAGAPRLSIVVPTMRRREELAVALNALEHQTLARREYELILAEDALADPHGPHPEGPSVRIVRGSVPGASAARNAGWRAARAPVLLFVDDDIRAPTDLAERHLRAHAQGFNAVLGHVRWAPELKVTPFMHWLDRGVQFDWRTIAGEGPKWWHFYTANASVSRALLETVGGFDEDELPFLYEDLDLARRMTEHGLKLVYDAGAVADHLVPVTLQSFDARLPRLAASELAF